MPIVTELAEAAVALRDPDDFTRFSVLVEGEGDLERVVRASALGRLHEGGVVAHIERGSEAG